MPHNLLKKYNELLDVIGMGESHRTKSLKAIFDRDIGNNENLNLNSKPIHPTHDKDGKYDVENLFNHLTRIVTDKSIGKREFDIHRASRLHWIRYHIEQQKKENMLLFSIKEPEGIRTYIYDKAEKYVIVLMPYRDKTSYYLLTAFKLTGKDAKRDKIIKKYNNRMSDVI